MCDRYDRVELFQDLTDATPRPRGLSAFLDISGGEHDIDGNIDDRRSTLTTSQDLRFNDERAAIENTIPCPNPRIGPTVYPVRLLPAPANEPWAAKQSLASPVVVANNSDLHSLPLFLYPTISVEMKGRELGSLVIVVLKAVCDCDRQPTHC